MAATLFDPKGFAKKLRLCFFDIPHVNDQSKKSTELFSTLADSSNLDIFNLTIIQIIIRKAWDEHFYFFIFFFLTPYLMFLTFYMIWSIQCDHETFDTTDEDVVKHMKNCD